MFCRACGKELAPGMAHCTSCGAEVKDFQPVPATGPDGPVNPERTSHPVQQAGAARPAPAAWSSTSPSQFQASRQFGMPVDRLLHPNEKAAFTFLTVLAALGIIICLILTITSAGAVLLLLGFVALIRYMTELIAMGSIKTNAVRVSDRQFPELNAMIQECAQRLGEPAPTVYIIQHNVFNAFAARLAGKSIVVLYSGVIDGILTRCTPGQVKFIIAHELGHHFAGHLGRWHRLVLALGGWILPLTFWYHRMAELSCDRIALYCVGDVQTAALALSNMTVGGQLAPALNLQAAIEQWHDHRGEFFVRYCMRYVPHPPNLERIAELYSAARALEIPLSIAGT